MAPSAPEGDVSLILILERNRLPRDSGNGMSYLFYRGEMPPGWRAVVIVVGAGAERYGWLWERNSERLDRLVVTVAEAWDLADSMMAAGYELSFYGVIGGRAYCDALGIHYPPWPLPPQVSVRTSRISLRFEKGGRNIWDASQVHNMADNPPKGWSWYELNQSIVGGVTNVEAEWGRGAARGYRNISGENLGDELCGTVGRVLKLGHRLLRAYLVADAGRADLSVILFLPTLPLPPTLHLLPPWQGARDRAGN